MSRPLIILIVVIVFVAGGVFWVLQNLNSANAVPMSTAYSQQIQNELAPYRAVDTLAPNLTIFQSQLFQALRPSGGVIPTATSTVSHNPFLPF